MSFDDWMNKNNGWQFDMPHQRDCYEAGAASRQGEVELLEKEIIETQEFLNNQNCIKQAEIDELNGCVEGWKSEYNSMCKRFERSQEINKELQNRIDKALSILSQMKHNGAYVASYILKGQNNG